MKRKYSIENGKKGGRPDVNKYITSFVIPKANLVILTEYQYNKLISKYGILLLNKALSLLNDWLATSYYSHKYRGKNNYALFRTDGWVINTAKEILIKETNTNQI